MVTPLSAVPLRSRTQTPTSLSLVHLVTWEARSARLPSVYRQPPTVSRTQSIDPPGHATQIDGTTATVARESSRVGGRDERFAAAAGRVDRIGGDRFGDGANRSRASQLTRATPAVRANQSRGRPSPTIDPGPRGRPTRREAIARRMSLALSSSACASPGSSSRPPATGRKRSSRPPRIRRRITPIPATRS
jgi:hypothetical protein